MYKKILAIKLRALGDTVLWTASLSALKEAFPKAEIDVVANSVWSPLLENHPAIHRLISHRVHEQRTARARSMLRLALELRKERYDCVLGFHASPSVAMMARMTGAKTRAIHFHGHTDPDRASTVTIPGKGLVKPIIERDLDTVRALGCVIDSNSAQTKIHLTDSERAGARAALDKAGLKAPVLAIGLGASRITKQWPIERFAKVAERFIKECNGSVLVSAGKGEHSLLNAFLSAISDSARSSLMTVEEPALRELSALYSECAVYLGNDSGPKHLAAASGTPTVTVFGPEDPFEWHPYSKDRHAVHFVSGLACRKDAAPGYPPWCGISVCVVEDHRCMKEIAPDSVFESVKRLAGIR